MITLLERGRQSSDRSSGFEYLRIILSVAVVLMHTTEICYGDKVGFTLFQLPYRPFYKILMPMFFALSGYLVSGSLVRSKTIGKFLALRFIRIYPALTVEVILSAFLLGPILTTLPLREYFSNSLFWSYLLNITGDIHYNLPGLFLTNPMPSVVNAQLWTIPFELLCYVSILVLSLLGIRKHRNLMLIIVPVATGLCIAAKSWKNGGSIPDVGGSMPGQLLVVAFLSGVAFYLFRDVVPWSRLYAAISLIVSIVLLSVPNAFYFAPIPVAYLTIYLGLTNVRRAGFLKHADLSYGIFLYGTAVQQAVAYLFPWSREWYLNFLIAMPIIVLIAAFSWHFIERPILGLKDHISRIEAWYLSKRKTQDLPRSTVPSESI